MHTEPPSAKGKLDPPRDAVSSQKRRVETSGMSPRAARFFESSYSTARRRKM